MWPFKRKTKAEKIRAEELDELKNLLAAKKLLLDARACLEKTMQIDFGDYTNLPREMYAPTSEKDARHDIKFKTELIGLLAKAINRIGAPTGAKNRIGAIAKLEKAKEDILPIEKELHLKYSVSDALVKAIRYLRGQADILYSIMKTLIDAFSQYENKTYSTYSEMEKFWKLLENIKSHPGTTVAIKIVNQEVEWIDKVVPVIYKSLTSKK